MSAASEIEKERAARQIASMLQKGLVWYEPTQQPDEVRYINTNIGNLTYYGYNKPKVVNEIGPLDITQHVPDSLCLVAVSSVPTSVQKIAMLEDLAHRVSRILGAGSDATVERVDPTAAGARTESVLGRAEHVQAAERQRLVVPMDYKTIHVPYIITIGWRVLA